MGACLHYAPIPGHGNHLYVYNVRIINATYLLCAVSCCNHDGLPLPFAVGMFWLPRPSFLSSLLKAVDLGRAVPTPRLAAGRWPFGTNIKKNLDGRRGEERQKKTEGRRREGQLPSFFLSSFKKKKI